MRGEQSIFQDGARGVAQAMAVLDLAMAGVRSELTDVPFDWFAAPAKPGAKPVAAPQAAVTPVAAAVAAQPVMPAATPLQVVPLTSKSEKSRDLLPASAPIKVLPVVEEIPARVWSEGEAGGVLLVMQGAKPEGRTLMLAQAMLAAVRLGNEALAMVGYEGKVSADDLKQAMTAQAATQVLVLGQGPLGILLGKNLGVEGWHAAGHKDIPGWDGPVGVTYPLDLLVKQPLFKRLAWQHLLNWGDTSPTITRSEV